MANTLEYNSAFDYYNTGDFTYIGTEIYQGFFASTINTVAASLIALGLVPVTDPRNARPLTVFIELPNFTCFNNQIADITIDLRVLGAPPGNQDATDYILGVVDTIMNSPLAVVAGSPSVAQIGSAELPAYDLTIRIASRRVP
jgi:hypothetical protein